jgi:pyruvate carboxylase subunit B
MISNLVSQLREANALDRLDEVYKEIPRVRKELGYTPLVTPTSQIVGIQAVQNVLFGRYKIITQQVKDFCYGLYGQPPAPVDPEVQKLALKGYERGETPITGRPADVLDPEMEKAYDDTKDIAKDMGDILIYAIYPTTGMRFLRWKYGLEAPPPETKGKTLEDIKREDEFIAKVRTGTLSDTDFGASSGMRKFNINIDGQIYKVGVEAVGGAPISSARVTAEATETPVKEVAPSKEAAPAKEPAPVTVGAGEDVVKAPMPGMVINYKAKVGDNVNEGDTIVVLEAMKMAIDLPAPKDGIVKSLNFKAGDRVVRDDVLAVISSPM